MRLAHLGADGKKKIYDAAKEAQAFTTLTRHRTGRKRAFRRKGQCKCASFQGRFVRLSSVIHGLGLRRRGITLKQLSAQ